MTPAEIRALYVETLARAAYENRLRPWSVDPAWADLPEHRRQMYVHMGMQATDALAEAGLLPTGVEKRAIDGGEKWVHVDGSHSVLAIYGSERRYFTDWREVSE